MPKKKSEREYIVDKTIASKMWDYDKNEFINNYNAVNRPSVMELLCKYSHKHIIIFENRKEAGKFLSQIVFRGEQV